MTQYLVAGRGAGKSTTLVKWVMRGHPIKGYPGWSRILIAAAMPPLHYITAFPALQHEFRENFLPALGKVVMTPNEAAGLRGLDKDVEFAVDDFHVLKTLDFGRAPALVAVYGTLFDEAADIEANLPELERRNRERLHAQMRITK
jgi:hypothetical protein